MAFHFSQEECVFASDFETVSPETSQSGDTLEILNALNPFPCVQKHVAAELVFRGLHYKLHLPLLFCSVHSSTEECLL